MQLTRQCKQCGTPLAPDKKLGAKYCDHACQQAYYKRKVRILDQIKKLTLEIRFNEKWQAENSEKLKSLEESKVNLEEIQKEIVRLLRVSKTLNQLLSCDAKAFRKHLIDHLDRHMVDFGDDYGMLKYGIREEQIYVLKKHHARFKEMRRDSKQQLIELKKTIEEKKKHNKKVELNALSWMIKNFSIAQDNSKLRKKLNELKAIDLDQLPIKPNPKKQADSTKQVSIKPIAKGVTGDQILKMKFNNLELEGELGQFLGLIQRNKCAIALTGDSGAGKTTFSFILANAFKKADQSIGYFSLESGITETTQTIIDTFNLVGSNFEVFEEGDLEDVRLHSKAFDCIIVDSYAKISSKAEDFENLRQDFPDTFFIVIFQKTTDGKIRGGSSILYNSTATIDIRLTKGNHRIAFMQKSRYGTENFVYSISRDRVLKNDKTPIKWSEIEENYPSPHHL